MKWKSEIERIVERVAIHTGISVSTVKEIVEHILLSTKKCLQHPEMPKILLHNFGTFKAKYRALERIIESLDANYSENKITKEEYEVNRKRLVSNYERITGKSYERNRL